MEGSSSSRLIFMLVDAVDLTACFMSRTNERRGVVVSASLESKICLISWYLHIRTVLNLKLR